MPHVIASKELAIIFLASIGHEVSSLLLPIPPQLSVELQTRLTNFGIQYATIAAAQVVSEAKFINPLGPSELLYKGMVALATASTVEEAASRGIIAAAVLVMSGLATNDPNTSLTFGGFLIVLVQNVLSPGFHAFRPPVLIQIYIAKNILIRIITEIRVERKRKELKLPRAKFKFKFSLFKNQTFNL